MFFENYIFADDEVGREFVAALTARAREGVRVRVIEDRRFARAMQEMYEEDLANATEIELDARRRVCSTGEPARRRRAQGGGSTARAAAGALRIGNTVGAAIADRRVLGPAEAGIMTGAALGLLILALIGVLWAARLARGLGRDFAADPRAGAARRARCGSQTHRATKPSRRNSIIEPIVKDMACGRCRGAPARTRLKKRWSLTCVSAPSTGRRSAEPQARFR